MEHREGVWNGADDQRERLRRLEPPDRRRLALEGGGLLAGTALASMVGAGFGMGFPVGTLVLLFMGMGLAMRRHDDRMRARVERVRCLRDEFGVGPVWLVDLMVRQGETVTGQDQGLLWIEGERIAFSGFRTSFALASNQTIGRVRHDASLGGLRRRLELALKRTTDVGPLAISFWPIAEGYRRQEDDATTLRYALNRFLDTRPLSSAEEIGQWPPVALGPGALAPRIILADLCGRVGGWLVVAAVLGGPLMFFNVPLGLIVVLGAFGLGVRSNREQYRRRLRALRDARRAGASP
jgi:hypothetical protein